MSAHDRKLDAIAAEVGRCIGILFDAQAQRRIATAWANGWITGDDAMDTLLTLDLIELPDAADD